MKSQRSWAIAPFTVVDMYDWDTATARLACQARGGHPEPCPVTTRRIRVHLIGEIVRRIAGKTLKDFVDEEIARPLDADFQIGARSEDECRIAELVPPPPPKLPVDRLGVNHPMIKTYSAPTPDVAVAHTHWFGHYRPFRAGGTANGVRLLHSNTIDLIFHDQAYGVDQVLKVPLRWGMGFALPDRESVPYIPEGRTCFWGGSIVMMDTDRRMTSLTR